MNIIIGFSRAKSPFKLGSKLIQLVENRPYSHCYVRFAHPFIGSHLIAQASHGYVNVVNNKYFIQDNEIIREYKVSCDMNTFNSTVFHYVNENLGKPYGYYQLFLIGIKKLLHFEVKMPNIDKFEICSEFAANLCKCLNIAVTDDLDYVTPSDLEQILINNNVQRIL